MHPPRAAAAAREPATFHQRRRFEQLDQTALASHQLRQVKRLLRTILPANRFYAGKLAGCELPEQSLEPLFAFPFTTKEELVGRDPGDALATNRTWPLDRYVHFHQTSGTRGHPLVVLDTAADWSWWIDCWNFVLDAAAIGPEDRALLAFSFGPFIGFWTAHDALVARSAMVIPGGGLSTAGRLELLQTSRATAVFCTPTYALHLAEAARTSGLDLASLPVRTLVVAGEPGGSVPATRAHIESAWGARLVDHAGATEVGAWGYADHDGRGLFVNECHFLAELIAVGSDRPAEPGELAELVLTTLGRHGSPVIRYRTGDLVRGVHQEDGPNRFLFLDRGLLGRADDMMIVRGVNVFPSSVEAVLREFPDVVEYRLTVRKEGAMDRLTVEVEDRQNDPQRLAHQLQLRLGLSVDIRGVPLGALPRFEGKGRRFVDERKKR